MPFSPDFSRTYEEGIKQACRDLEISCERVEEQVFRERITDRICQQITDSHMVVADVSGRNPNVFYELGYAHALHKPTILVTRSREDVPFDIKDFQIVVYQSPDDLRAKLLPHLTNVLDGPSDPTQLGGRWILGIYDQDVEKANAPALPIKVDGYRVVQHGKILRGSIRRLGGEGAPHREYDFSGYADGREMVYSFWSRGPDVPSWGCCNLHLESDFVYEGRYFWPLSKARQLLRRQSYGARIKLVRADRAIDRLGIRADARLCRRIRAWVRNGDA